MENQKKIRAPSLRLALLPVVLTLFVLGLQLFYFGDFTPHIPLVIGVAITSLVGLYLGYDWSMIEGGMFRVINVSLPSVSVLIVVGMLIGVWIASGVTPTLIYYGLKLISPEVFLAAAMALCAIVSVSLGTSWGTISTVGLALMGVGAGFNIPAYWTAGAVISGAFFGDKISPLSDTTNLAPAVTNVRLFDHIQNMMATTIPAMVIAFTIYAFAGFFLGGDGTVSLANINEITVALESNFLISPWLLLPVLLVIGLAIAQKPPIPSLFAGVVLGGVISMFAQGVGMHDVFVYANSGYSIKTGVAEIDILLNRGGIQAMMWTISLILIALAFGGALERIGCLGAIVKALLSKTHTFGGLQTSAMCTSIAINIVAGDPYLSIVLPGRMYAPLYRGMGYSALNLSRAIEEGGTLLSPLIPWNASGAYVISTLALGVFEGKFEDLLYIPLSFACWISPVLGLIYSWTGLFSPRASLSERREWYEGGLEVADLSAYGYENPLKNLDDESFSKEGGLPS